MGEEVTLTSIPHRHPFLFVDEIVELCDERILTKKLADPKAEFFRGHYPGQPVMPGVLMLEAMTQVGAWLVRATEDFQHSMVVLKEARNVKYGQFVEPGQTLRVTAEIVSQTDRETVLKARGTVEGRTTVGGRLVLERYNLSEQNPAKAETDKVVRQQMRELFALLWQPNGQGSPSSNGQDTETSSP